MKFVSLKMRNWRSFHGDHEVVFATDSDRPVTLVLGPNGSGKTALLNTFTWAIYGEFTDGFDHPHKLVNYAAADASSTAEAFVEICLQHEGDEYSIKRSTNASRQLTSDYDLVVTKNGERAVEADVHRIIPKPLKELFFFPAETLSTASVLKSDNTVEGTSFDVGTAIRSLLSGDIYQNASADLRKAINGSILKTPKRGHNQESVDSARLQYDQAESDLDTAESRKEELPTQLTQATTKAAKAKQAADQYDPKEIQKWHDENNRLNQDVAKSEQLVNRAEALYVDLARNSHLHFSRFAIQSATKRLDLAETAGLMPPRIHESVLKKTIETGKCTLCLTTLTDESRIRIGQLRDNVGDAKVAVCGLEARTMLKQFLSQSDTEGNRLREDVEELAKILEIDTPTTEADYQVVAAIIRSCISVADGLHRQAKADLENFNANSSCDRPAEGASPVDLAINAQRRVDQLSKELGLIDDKITEFKKARDKAFKDFKEKSGKSDEHKQKTTAIEILQDAKSYFDAAKQGLEEFGRKDFENAINETYGDLIAKPFDICVNPDFSIKVKLADTDKTMPLSQSEKVLLLIAFLGSIARLAPHYETIAKRNQQLEMAGSVKTSGHTGFPVVLDSPTSPLDGEYEKDVVDALPKLLPQIIVPVSAKSIDVWRRITDKIGKIYIMELTSPKTTDRTISWNGKDHVYSKNDDSITLARTRIVPLN